MIDSVLNEYIHTDFHATQYDNGNQVIVYEPLDNVAEDITLEGEIVLMQHKIPFRFRMGSRLIIEFDSDSVLWGRLINNQITLCWKIDPGDHYLVASYNLAGEKEKVDWLQEGF